MNRLAFLNVPADPQAEGRIETFSRGSGGPTGQWSRPTSRRRTYRSDTDPGHTTEQRVPSRARVEGEGPRWKTHAKAFADSAGSRRGVGHGDDSVTTLGPAWRHDARPWLVSGRVTGTDLF
jgi:hypothetical protein